MTRFLTAVIAVFFFALPLFSQNIWIKQSSVYNESFKKVVFPDSLYGWIAGDSGIIINTSNGGSSWVTQSRNTQDYIVDIFFLNRIYGWAVAWRVSGSVINSIIYSTSNGGQNWNTDVYPDLNTLINTVHFVNQQTGFIGCSYTSTKSILRTTSGGAIWFPANVDTNFASYFPVRKIKFLDSSTGFAVGGYLDICGVVWKTTDGGINWSSKTVGGEPYHSIDFPDLNTVVISGGDYEFGVSVNYSTDIGESWNYFFTGYFGIGYSLSFRTNTEGWIAAGFSQMFLKTTNSGVSWSNVFTPGNSYVYALTFPNQKTGWAVGDSGTILKFTGTPIGINNSEINIPFYYCLGQNYPNPFNPSTNIPFELGEPAYVSLKVYDVTGRKVAEPINGKFGRGKFITHFDASAFPAGIFIYKIELKGTVTKKVYSESKKMLLIK